MFGSRDGSDPGTRRSRSLAGRSRGAKGRWASAGSDWAFGSGWPRSTRAWTQRSGRSLGTGRRAARVRSFCARTRTRQEAGVEADAAQGGDAGAPAGDGEAGRRRGSGTELAGRGGRRLAMLTQRRHGSMQEVDERLDSAMRTSSMGAQGLRGAGRLGPREVRRRGLHGSKAAWLRAPGFHGEGELQEVSHGGLVHLLSKREREVELRERE